MLAWLRDAMDAAQRDAEAATPGPWAPKAADPGDDEVYTEHDGEHGDLFGEVVAYVRGQEYRGKSGRTLANMRLIATHADPNAVLRRIAADRKLLELHADDGCHDCTTCAKEGEETNELGCAFHQPLPYPCDTVRLLAEAWGWTEDVTGDIHDADLRNYAAVAEALKESLRRTVDTMPAGHPVANLLESAADSITRPSCYPGRADRPAVSDSCYQASWGWIHVKPGCHCTR
ncbi:hypothetical protein DT019_02975 [Streptomyces sp. SDr-06]|nr:hypothetical protein DT019_02975 [Streptomyces sp. SDr-06]